MLLALLKVRQMSSVVKRIIATQPSSGATQGALSSVELGKQRASYSAVNENIKSGQVVGVGSGSTVVYVAERLGQRVREEGLQITCIPTSHQARELIIKNGLVLGDLSRNPQVDVAIDGADEISPLLNCIKGGGGCHVQEKVVASSATLFVLVADDRKLSPGLGTTWVKGVPLEVVPIALEPVMQRLRTMGGSPVVRTSAAKMGPAISDNGNFLVDVVFGAIEDGRADQLAKDLKLVTGIVDTGLFVNMASKAYIGMADGSVQILEKQ